MNIFKNKENISELLLKLSSEEQIELFLVISLIHDENKDLFNLLHSVFSLSEIGEIQDSLIKLQILIEDSANILIGTELKSFDLKINKLEELGFLSVEDLANLHLLRDFRNKAAHDKKKNKQETVVFVFLKGISIFANLYLLRSEIEL